MRSRRPEKNRQRNLISGKTARHLGVHQLLDAHGSRISSLLASDQVYAYQPRISMPPLTVMGRTGALGKTKRRFTFNGSSGTMGSNQGIGSEAMHPDDAARRFSLWFRFQEIPVLPLPGSPSMPSRLAR